MAITNTGKRSLTCLASNKHYVHSFQKKSSTKTCSIVTTTFPIEKDSIPMETLLPDYISSFLMIQPPIELLLASTTSNSTSSSTSTSGSIVLCLYTSKSIYLLTLNNETFDVIDIEEPLEVDMLRSSLEEQDIHIVRVRYPSTRSNYLYPSGTILVLLSNGSLVVYHPTLKASSLPVLNVIVLENRDDAWVDFVIDHNHTVFYLTSYGLIYGASPIVIDSMMVPKWKMDLSIEQCHSLLEILHEEKEEGNGVYGQAQKHRLKAERQFYSDVFVESEDNPEFVSCRYRSMSENQSACLWPILLQGPLLDGGCSAAEELADDEEEAFCVEVLVEEDQSGAALGLVIAYSHGRVDVVYLSRPLEVRFGFESEEDKDVLNQRILRQSAVVESVQMETSTATSSSNATKPIMLKVEQDGTMIHYADQSGVFTITTNVASVMQGTSTNKKVETNAWPCVTLSNPTTSLTGVDIVQTADLGHILITKFSNGSIEAVNLTAALYMTTYPLVSPPSTQLQLTQHPSSSLPPTLLEQISPLINQIQKTRANITTLVDSSKLKPPQADASTIATLLFYRNTWEKGYILPLLQLEKLIQCRLPIITSLAQSQKKTLEKLSSQIKTLQEEYSKSMELASTLESNATILSKRSATLLQTTRELTPNITRAETQYHEFLQAQSHQYSSNQKQIQGILQKLDTLKQQQQQNNKIEYCLELNSQQRDMTNDLLSGNDVKLQTSLENVRLVKKDLEGVKTRIELLKKH